MILKVPLILRYHKIYIYVFHSATFLYIVIVSVSINSILSIIIKHILLSIFCNDDKRSNAMRLLACVSLCYSF